MKNKSPVVSVPHDAPKPCPFCGINLELFADSADLDVRRYGARYQHAENDCFLTDFEVRPVDVAGWNRRASIR